MFIPYLTKTVELIEITDKQIKRLEIEKTFGNLSIKYFDKELIENNNVSETIKLLTSRKQFSNLNLHIVLPLNKFEYIYIDHPEIEDSEELEEWVYEYLSNHVSEDPEKMRFRFLEIKSEKDKKILISFAHRDVIEEYEKICKSSGLRPVYIGSGIEKLGYSFLFDEALITSKSAIIFKYADKTYILNYISGDISKFMVFNSDKFKLFDIIDPDEYKIEDQSSIQINGSLKNIWIYENECVIFNEKYNKETEEITKRNFPLHVGKYSIPGDYSLLLGVSFCFLFKLPNHLNYLSDFFYNDSSLFIEKKKSLKSVYSLFIIFISLLLLTKGTLLLSNYKIKKLDSSIKLISDKVQLIEEKKDQNNKLQNLIVQTKTVTVENTHFTGFLEIIGQSIPHNLWLEKINISNISKKYKISITGYAINQFNISSLIKNFENVKFLKTVTLSYINTVSRKGIKKDNLDESQSIYEFEILLEN